MRFGAPGGRVASSSETVEATRAGSRLQITTLSPRDRNLRAMALPAPLVPPVTTTLYKAVVVVVVVVVVVRRVDREREREREEENGEGTGSDTRCAVRLGERNEVDLAALVVVPLVHLLVAPTPPTARPRPPRPATPPPSVTELTPRGGQIRIEPTDRYRKMPRLRPLRRNFLDPSYSLSQAQPPVARGVDTKPSRVTKPAASSSP